MMKRLLAGVIFFLVCQAAQAQESDSLSTEQLIKNYKPQKTELITKARAMLTDIFPDSDRAKVLQLIHYMDSAYQDQGYTVFSSDENILLGYWTGDYQQLLGEIKPHLEYDMGRRYYQGYQARYYDDLDDVIMAATNNHKDSLIGNIRVSALRDDERDFLAIYLSYLLPGQNPGSVSDSLEKETDLFLQNHARSPYAEFVKKELRNHGRALPNFGYGMAFSPAGGIILTKELSSSFRNSYAMDIDFEFYFKRVAGFFKVGGGFSKTKVDIPVTSDSLVWKKGSKTGPLLVDGSVGYIVLDKRKVTLTPFAGISYTKFAPSSNDRDDHEELEDFKRSAHSYHCGLNLDFIFGYGGEPGYTKAYGFVRLRYGCYFPQMEKRYDGYSGMIHNVSVAIGGLLRVDKKANRSPVPFDNYRYQ